MSGQEIKSLSNGATTRQEFQRTPQQPQNEKIVPTLVREEAFHLSHAFESLQLEKANDQHDVSEEKGYHDVVSGRPGESQS